MWRGTSSQSRGAAIDQNGNPGWPQPKNITNPIQGKETNTYKIDTYGKYGVCDFDGDGIDDLFLATGVSWWYMSGAKMHWTFLNSHPEQLDQVLLGDFNGDHRCDVLTVHGNSLDISSGGTDVRRPLGVSGVSLSELQVGDFNGDGTWISSAAPQMGNGGSYRQAIMAGLLCKVPRFP